MVILQFETLVHMYFEQLLPSALARGSNPAAWALMSARVCIYIYMAIVRSRLGMQLPFTVNARACAITTYIYGIRKRTASRRRRAGAAAAHRNQRRQKAEANTE